MPLRPLVLFVAIAVGGCLAQSSRAGETASVMPSLSERFASSGADTVPSTTEVPNFQKHIGPLLGRLGCNGRACHGSFQGRGGFQLTLFGYDFQADYDALLKAGEGRVDVSKPLESLILTKPTDADNHEGGQRYQHGSWEYWVLRKWVEARAPFERQEILKLKSLEVAPREIVFQAEGQKQQLKALAHWEDGSVEDVSCLCRFQSNDPAVATVDESGLITCGQAGDTHVVAFYDNAVVPIPIIRPLSELTGDRYPQVAVTQEIDRLVLEKLRKLGVVPSEVCSDHEFLRRASLDVTGTLPTASEVQAFVADPSANKRSRKIDELLTRPGYAAQWATFLCDMTGNNDDQLRNFFPVREQPPVQWYQWIYQRLQNNVPYDQLVEGIVTAKSRLPGESYAQYCEKMSDICQDPTGKSFADRPGLVHYWARNNFKTEEERAIGFAYAFLGVRIQCAQCHKHPFDQWSKTDFDNFERLFGGIQANQNTMASDARSEFSGMVEKLGVASGLKGNELRKKLGELLVEGKTIPFPELVVRGNSNRPQGKKNKKTEEQVVHTQAKLLGGDWVDLDQEDVRGKLAEWLRSPDNPYFARALVNRVWAHYFSLGIVNPSDDLSLANAPSNEALLDYMARGFIANKFDLKWLHREILSSDTYQRGWTPNATNRSDDRNFSRGSLRRLPAEAAYDAVWMALADDSSAAELVQLGRPRALTTAGASARIGNANSDSTYALSVFGRSVRETNCDCDRSNEPSLLQTVFLLNDSAVHQMLKNPSNGWVASVASKYGWPAPIGGNERPVAAERPDAAGEALARQMERMEARKKMAQQNGQLELVSQIERRQANMRQQLEAKAVRSDSSETPTVNSDPQASDDEVAGASSSPMTDEQAMWIAEQAYLRSLSRQPNPDELATALSYLKSESNPTLATENILWSLVNTKEFILNH